MRYACGVLIVGSGVGEAAPPQAGGSGGASAPRTPRRTVALLARSVGWSSAHD